MKTLNLFVVVVSCASPAWAQSPIMRAPSLGADHSFLLAGHAAGQIIVENGDPALRSRIYQLAFTAQSLEPVLTEINTGVSSINVLVPSMVKTAQGTKELSRYLWDFGRKIENKVYKPVNKLKYAVDALANITPASKVGPAAEALKNEALRLGVLCAGLNAPMADLVQTIKFYQPGQLYDEALDVQQFANEAAAAVDGLIEKSEALVRQARQDQSLPDFR